MLYVEIPNVVRNQPKEYTFEQMKGSPGVYVPQGAPGYVISTHDNAVIHVNNGTLIVLNNTGAWSHKKFIRSEYAVTVNFKNV